MSVYNVYTADLGLSRDKVKTGRDVRYRHLLETHLLACSKTGRKALRNSCVTVFRDLETGHDTYQDPGISQIPNPFMY